MNKNNGLLTLLFITIALSIGYGQADTIRLRQLIKETNDQFLYPYTPGIYLSPFELLEHNSNRMVKHLEMVDSITVFSEFPTEKDTTPVWIKDNFTIITKPDDTYNSYTYEYLADGKISKTYRGRHLNNHYVYDDNGYLIQHGFGGEFKKAKRTDKTFEWYLQKSNHLTYTTAYDKNDQLLYYTTFRSKESEMALLSTTQFYTWTGPLLESMTKVHHYTNGSDTTFLRIDYGPLGKLHCVYTKQDGQENWGSSCYTTQIDTLEDSNIRIAIKYNDQVAFDITYDRYDNWIQLKNGIRTIRRAIKYRTTPRKNLAKERDDKYAEGINCLQNVLQSKVETLDAFCLTNKSKAEKSLTADQINVIKEGIAGYRKFNKNMQQNIFGEKAMEYGNIPPQIIQYNRLSYDIIDHIMTCQYYFGLKINYANELEIMYANNPTLAKVFKAYQPIEQQLVEVITSEACLKTPEILRYHIGLNQEDKEKAMKVNMLMNLFK